MARLIPVRTAPPWGLTALALAIPLGLFAGGGSEEAAETVSARYSELGTTTTADHLLLRVHFATENCARVELDLRFRLLAEGQGGSMVAVSDWLPMTLGSGAANPAVEESGCREKVVTWLFGQDFETLGFSWSEMTTQPFEIGGSVGLLDGEGVRLDQAIGTTLADLLGNGQGVSEPRDLNWRCGYYANASTDGPLTPPALPTETQEQQIEDEPVHTEYAAVGSTSPLAPPDPVEGASPNNVPLSYGSGMDYSLHSVLATQGYYKTLPVSPPSGSQVPWTLAGASNATVFNVNSGRAKNRPRYEDPRGLSALRHPNGTQTRYVYGLSTAGNLVRGGTFWDMYSALGAIRVAYAGLSSSGDVQALEGTRHQAYIGESGLATRTNPTQFDQDEGQIASVDARNLVLPADRKIENIAPTALHFAIGSQAVALVQQKSAPESENSLVTIGSEKSARLGGHIHTAIACLAEVASRMSGSHINVSEAVGIRNELAVLGAAGAAHDLAGNKSRIDKWTGIEATLGFFFQPSFLDSSPAATNGVVVRSQDVTSGAGSPVRSLPIQGEDLGLDRQILFGSSPEIPTERGATLLTMDGVVFGDDRREAGQGGNADTVSVPSVHLTGRDSLPGFSTQLPPSQRVGVLYYDSDHSSLRVSRAGRSQNPTNWHQAPVVWSKLSLGATPPSPTDSTTFATPRVMATGVQLTSDGCSFTCTPKGFPPTSSVKVFWRIVGRGPDEKGATAWLETTYTSPAVPVGCDFVSGRDGTPGWDGTTDVAGQTIELLAVDITSSPKRWAGTSFRIPRQ